MPGRQLATSRCPVAAALRRALRWRNRNPLPSHRGCSVDGRPGPYPSAVSRIQPVAVSPGKAGSTWSLQFGHHAGIRGGRTRPAVRPLPAAADAPRSRAWDCGFGSEPACCSADVCCSCCALRLRRALPLFGKGIGGFSRLAVAGCAIRLVLLRHSFLLIVALQLVLQLGEFLFDVPHDFLDDLLKGARHGRSQVEVRVDPVSQVEEAGGHDGRQEREIDGAWKPEGYGLAEVYARGKARRLFVLGLPCALIAAAIGMWAREEQRSG